MSGSRGEQESCHGLFGRRYDLEVFLNIYQIMNITMLD